MTWRAAGENGSAPAGSPLPAEELQEVFGVLRTNVNDSARSFDLCRYYHGTSNTKGAPFCTKTTTAMFS